MRRKPLHTVLIIDGFSTAAYLAPAFRAYGLRCVHLLSSIDLPAQYRNQLVPSDYICCLLHEGNVQATAKAIREFNIDLILHGFDSALELADQLANALNITYKNPLESSGSRRDKYLMTEAVRRANLRAPQQHVSDEVESILAWTSTHGRLPVVIKPTRSAGVRGVKICRTMEQVRQAAEAVLNSDTYYNEPNEQVLVQSCSEGQEYIVDSVSFAGQHHLVSLWEVERERSHAPRLEKMVVVDHREPRYRHLIDYAFKVLDALDLHFGPSHLEIMDTADGPTIIELNARLHGSLDPRLTTSVTGENQISATVEAFLNPEQFLRMKDVAPQFHGHCGHILLVSRGQGRLRKEFVWDEIAALPSFVSTKQWVKVGDTVHPTTDLKTALGMVGVFHESLQTLEQDMRQIRRLEDQFFSDEEAFEVL